MHIFYLEKVCMLIHLKKRPVVLFNSFKVKKYYIVYSDASNSHVDLIPRF